MTPRTMTAEDIEQLIRVWPGNDKVDSLIPAVLIQWRSSYGTVRRGLVIQLGGNLSSTWQADDVIVFWSNGDVTTLIGGDIKPTTKLQVYYGPLTATAMSFNLFDMRYSLWSKEC